MNREQVEHHPEGKVAIYIKVPVLKGLQNLPKMKQAIESTDYYVKGSSPRKFKKVMCSSRNGSVKVYKSSSKKEEEIIKEYAGDFIGTGTIKSMSKKRRGRSHSIDPD